MVILGTAAAIVLWLWTQYLPGYFVSRLFAPAARGAERHLLALMCGFSVVPFAIFMVGVAGAVPMDRPLIFACASAINILGAGLIGRVLWRAPDIGRADTALLLGATAALALFIVFGFRGIDAGDTLTSIQHCLYVIALHGIQNDPSASLPLWDAQTGDFLHFLIHQDSARLNGLGELLYEQRIANVPILGVPIATVGMLGWYSSGLHSTVIVALASLLSARRAGASKTAAAVSAAIFVWATHVFCAYYVNENHFALAFVCFLLWAALDRETTRPGMALLIGVLTGHLVGIRHPSALFVPAVAVALAWQPGAWRQRLTNLALAGAGSLVAVAPWLYINWIKLGNPLTHPKIQPDSGGRVIENQLLGRTFVFKPLQWPFTDRVVRTVWNPFPTFLWLPLLVVRCFGQVSIALAAFGVGLQRRQRRVLVLLALFAVPHSIAIALLEGVDWEQITYAAPGLAPLAVLVAWGVDGLRVSPRPRLLRRAAVAAGLLIAVMGGTRSLRGVNFPVDMRLIDREIWPEPPPRTPALDSVAERLTPVFAPLPEMPVWRTEWARRLIGTLGSVAKSAAVPQEGGLPVYPSGQAVVLSAYSQGVPRHYRFLIAPGALREAGTPFRTAVWLHTMAFRFPAERLEVNVERRQGRYVIDLKPRGAAAEARDFSFWLNPWYPPIESIHVTVDGQPAEGVRVMPWGGTLDDGEQMYLVSNYPPEIVDTVEVPFTVDAQGSRTHCGIWIFLADVDGTSIETLSPGGATDMKWHGATSGTLIIPRPIYADELVLFSEPYCSDHIPQYGNRFGRTVGPFGRSPESAIHVTLDRWW